MCFFKYPAWENDFPQDLQLYGFPPWTILIWEAKVCWIWKDFVQILQLKSFPVLLWVWLKCFLKQYFDLNAFSQILHLNSFILTVKLSMWNFVKLYQIWMYLRYHWYLKLKQVWFGIGKQLRNSWLSRWAFYKKACL